MKNFYYLIENFDEDENQEIIEEEIKDKQNINNNIENINNNNDNNEKENFKFTKEVATSVTRQVNKKEKINFKK